jgi:hypothetical protein
MAAVTTERLLGIALELAGWDEAPGAFEVVHPGTRISHVLVGLEVGTAELFMARQLGYHAVVALSPCGTAGALARSWERERERMMLAGVPPHEAEWAVARARAHHELDALDENYDRSASVARLLEMPFVTVGSPLDEVAQRTVARTVDEALARQADATLADLRDALHVLPEYAVAQTEIALALGAWPSRPGKVAVLANAYARSEAEVIQTYLAHGVETVCCASLASSAARRLRESGARGSVLVLGRVATASVGASSYIARLRAEGIEVTPSAGILSPDGTA